MKHEIITTLDGSTSIFLPDLQETYHSKNGAIQEAYHVFIKNGLDLIDSKNISILEIGFGTGLNAFITFLEAEKNQININYTTIEAFPVSLEIALQMNFVEELNVIHHLPVFESLHILNWEEKHKISNYFDFTKCQIDFNEICIENQFDLIYFDAFGYAVQPELWSEAIFVKMYNALNKNGIIVTYAARSIISKNLFNAGFVIKKVAGPPGKREMTIAFKN